MRKRKEAEKPISTHPCAATGCTEAGEYKAPVSRTHPGQYQYLCLEHIREFNRAWDYFEGWNREEIEHFMHDAPYGDRPTWKIGTQPLFTNEALRASFYKMLGEEEPAVFKRKPKAPRKETEALALLDLEPGVDLAAMKTQYKKLVKKYHPDVNKAKDAEEIFKRITVAYTYLSKLYGKNE